jgi:hypothetical protein
MQTAAFFNDALLARCSSSRLQLLSPAVCAKPEGRRDTSKGTVLVLNRGFYHSG